MKRSILGLCCLAVLVLVVSGAALAMDSPTPAIDLEDWALQSQDYPMRVQELSRGPVTARDVHHPLNHSNTTFKNLPQFVYAYKDAYESGVVFADGDHSAFAGHYLYVYADATQAQAAAEALLKTFAQVTISEGKQFSGTFMRGTSRVFTASEGDRVHTFVGTQDNVVTLFIVNGLESDTLQTTYETLLKDLVLH